MSDLQKFIGVDAMLTDIGRGIGLANKELVMRSKSDLGSLAVKTADVTVSFEITSVAEKSKYNVSSDYPLLLGAKTLSFGTDTFEEKQINRCTITLNIVAVAPATEKETSPSVTGKPGTIPDDMMPDFVKTLGDKISMLDLSPEMAKTVEQDMKAIKEMVQYKRFNDARTALVRFAEKYASTINVSKGV